MPAGCSSPIRSTIRFATGCPLPSRIWASNGPRTWPASQCGSTGCVALQIGRKPPVRLSTYWQETLVAEVAGPDPAKGATRIAASESGKWAEGNPKHAPGRLMRSPRPALTPLPRSRRPEVRVSSAQGAGGKRSPALGQPLPRRPRLRDQGVRRGQAAARPGRGAPRPNPARRPQIICPAMPAGSGHPGHRPERVALDSGSRFAPAGMTVRAQYGRPSLWM
jgi:hypothetical protein